MWRPPRSYHCRICTRCIRKMDHHCPWVNNCVGEWNQKYFVLFVFYALLTCVIAGGIIGCVWKRVWEMDSLDHTPHVVSVLIQASLFGLFTAMILWDQVASILSDEVSFFDLFQTLFYKDFYKILIKTQIYKTRLLWIPQKI